MSTMKIESTLPDPQMQNLLNRVRTYSNGGDSHGTTNGEGTNKRTSLSSTKTSANKKISVEPRVSYGNRASISPRPSFRYSTSSSISSSLNQSQPPSSSRYSGRRNERAASSGSSSSDSRSGRDIGDPYKISEAGINRRESANRVLNEDTDSFIIGDRVYVDGIRPGSIAYIGATTFGLSGDDWAGVVLDETLGKNDGSVAHVRYFQCEPGHGVFSKLFRLTREPTEGAEEVLDQVRRYGYDIVPGGNGNTKYSTGSIDRKYSSQSRGDRRSHTPEYVSRKSCTSNGRWSRSSPTDHMDGECAVHGRKGSENEHGSTVNHGRSSSRSSPFRYSTSRSSNYGSVTKDPAMNRLETNVKRISLTKEGSEVPTRTPLSTQHSWNENRGERKVSNNRWSSTSGEGNTNTYDRRKISEAGAKNNMSEEVLNDSTESLMIGQRVFVNGIQPGRIAYIGQVHFARGDLAGIHLEEADGKHDGTVNGIMYFQCEPKHGVFAKLHRLTLYQY